jgi:hypothetical protein
MAALSQIPPGDFTDEKRWECKAISPGLMVFLLSQGDSQPPLTSTHPNGTPSLPIRIDLHFFIIQVKIPGLAPAYGKMFR